MSSSYVQVWLHIIFSTKERKAFLKDPQVRKETHAFLAGICKELGSEARIVGGVEDHVHILCSLPKTISIADLIQKIKRPSSIWIKQRFPELADFGWQNGYGAFSVSQSGLDAVYRYIDNQEEHHQKISFKDEFLKYLSKFKIPFNPIYIWK